MKIRSGFVSNSSSSSFIVLTTPKNLESIKKNASGDFKEFIDQMVNESQQTVKIHGLELVDLSRVIHDSYIDGWDDEENRGDDNCGYDLWLQLLEEIARGGGYTHDECCG